MLHCNNSTLTPDNSPSQEFDATHNALNGYFATVLSRDYSIIITRPHLSAEARSRLEIFAPQQPWSHPCPDAGPPVSDLRHDAAR
ncbi:hypothetical protein, partial [Chromobacterium piscinae]|uniref:hypothetical protein n=1 Tax=Chromobacterium piscinae TaxID=686831 RepID=UPI0032614C50